MLLRRSFIVLLIIYFAIYLFIAALFALAYYRSENGIYDTRQQTHTVNWPEAIYFSIVTQSTVGYGDLIPSGRTRFLAATQVTVGTLLYSVLTSILIFRLFRTDPNIIFPLPLAYNPQTHTFSLRYVNATADDIGDVQIKVFLRKRLSEASDQLIRDMMYPVDVTIGVEPYVYSMMVIACRTEPREQDESRILHTEHVNRISLLDLDLNSELIIVMSGSSVSTGDTVMQKKVYTFEDVLLGEYADTERDLPPRAFGKSWAWKKRNYQLFHTV